MFTGKIGNWRNQQQKITRLKAEAVEDKNKPKLFEDAINYITTSKTAPQELVSEIMGFRETKCIAFRKLSIDNGLLFYKEITEEIIYLLAVCFFKEVNQKPLNLDKQIDPYKFKKWLIENGYNYVAEEIKDKSLKKICLKDDKIYFNNKAYAPIKLTKLEITPTNLFKYTNRINHLGIKNIYSNHNEKCLGATNYWLLVIANSYINDHNKRQEMKNKYIKRLETNTIEFGGETLKYIKNFEIAELIDELQDAYYIDEMFEQIQDIYTTKFHLGTDIFKLFSLMEINKLEQLYAQIVTHYHAMGLAIISKGVLIKILAYDPNDCNSYMSMIINPEEENKSQLTDFFKQLYCFRHSDSNTDMAIILRCHTFETLPKQPKKISKISTSIEIYKTIKSPNELLYLGMGTYNHELVEVAIKTYGARDKNCIARAVYGFLPHMLVKLLIQLVPEAINHVDKKGYTPLCHAVAVFRIEMVYILLRAGAEINPPGSISALTLATKDYNNKILSSILEKAKNGHNY